MPDLMLLLSGSLYGDRVFISNAELQKYVLRHVLEVGPPLTPYEHNAMLAALETDCPSLLAFIDKENTAYTGGNKNLIKNLAYASPVSRLAPIQTWTTIEVSGYSMSSLSCLYLMLVQTCV